MDDDQDGKAVPDRPDGLVVHSPPAEQSSPAERSPLAERSMQSSPAERSMQSAPAGAADGRSRRPRGRLIGAVVVLLLGLGGGAWLFTSTEDSCPGAPLRITVGADPAIAPAVRQVAARFNVQTRQVNGRCVRADVLAVESAGLARSLAGQTFGARPAVVDAWIPGSTIWLTLARATGATTVPPGGNQLAASPVVLAATRPVTDELRAAKAQAGWKLLAKGKAGDVTLTRRMLDPAAGLSGVVPLIALSRLAAEPAQPAEPAEPADPAESTESEGSDREYTESAASKRAVRDYVRAMHGLTAAGVDSMFSDLTGLPRSDRALLVTTEQSVVAYNGAHGPNPAVAMTPVEGTLPVDYPFVVLGDQPERREAAEAFQYALSTPLARHTFQSHGFRSPEGTLADKYARSHGLSGEVPKWLDLPPEGQTLAAAAAWNADRQGGRTLILTDVSRSMAEPATQQVTAADTRRLGANAGNRLGRAVRALLDALPLFPESTDLGLWVFGPGAGGSRPYKELVPTGPIDKPAGQGARTRREVLTKELPRLEPRPAGDTGLYDVLPAAYRQLKDTPEDGKTDTLLILTDGDDEDSLVPGALVDTLRREQAAQRPIRIDIVAFGPDVDAAGLRRITDLTGGKLYLTADPAALGTVFAEALSSRLCLLTCSDT